jgi:hypothetical protein
MRSKRWLAGAVLTLAAFTAGVTLAPGAGAVPGTGQGLRSETYACSGFGSVTVDATRGNVAFLAGNVFHAGEITVTLNTTNAVLFHKAFGQKKGLVPVSTCTASDGITTVVIAVLGQPS